MEKAIEHEINICNTRDELVDLLHKKTVVIELVGEIKDTVYEDIKLVLYKKNAEQRKGLHVGIGMGFWLYLFPIR